MSRVVFALAALSCTRADTVAVTAPARWAAPAAESGLCADVADVRACWNPNAEPRLVPRPLPATAPASPLGWRCLGQGDARTCVDRLREAPVFVCQGGRCVQRHPRQPSDGEWSCTEMAGATICLGGEPAAGAAAGPDAAGWFCGARAAERVCVDLSPDFPDGAAAGWRCQAERAGVPSRVCERSETHALGDRCEATHPCVDGSRCAGGRCLPPRPRPTCFADSDCPGSACRFGTCREDPG